MIILFARHGQTDWNKQKRFQSRNDILLNDTGLRQAKGIKSLINEKKHHIDYCCSSPLQRASKTAEILLEGSAVSFQLDARLLEINLGDYEGKLESDLEHEFGEQFRTWLSQLFFKAAPNGETFEEALGRAQDFMTELERQSFGTVLLVAHQGINIALKAALSGDTSLDALKSYKQANNELDVWDADKKQFLERLCVSD